MITTKNGSTVKIDLHPTGALVILDHPDAPEDMRHKEAGRIIDVGGELGFQPAPLAAFAMRPDVLRAIADLIEQPDEHDENICSAGFVMCDECKAAG
jgi:hypothetical protein